MTRRITALILVVIMVFTLTACNNKKTPDGGTPSYVVTTEQNWPSEYLGADVLPKIKGGEVNYYKFYGQILRIYLYNVDDESFMKYIETLKSIGYKNISVETKEAFAGSLDDYYLAMNRDVDTHNMVIELTTPPHGRRGYIKCCQHLSVRFYRLWRINNVTVVTEDIGKRKLSHTADAIAAGLLRTGDFGSGFCCGE